MRNIDIVTDDVQSFKTIIEILSGIVHDVNAEIIKDKNAYVIAQKKGPTDEDESDESDESDDYSQSGSDESDESDESEEPVTTKKGKTTKSTKANKSSETTKAKKSSQDDSNSDEGSDADGDADGDTESDSDIESEEEENPGQIKILTSNDDQVMLLFVTLDAKHFKTFNIIGRKGDPNPNYTIGLDLDELNKFMKCTSKEGTLSVYQDTNMMEYICFKVADTSRGMDLSCDLRRINIEKPPNKNIQVDVSMVVRMPCALFHKTCKDLQQFDPFAEFVCDRDTFKITCTGEQSNNERKFYDMSRTSGDPDDPDANKIKITLNKDMEREQRKREKSRSGSASGSDDGSDNESADDSDESSDASSDGSSDASSDSENSDESSDFSEDPEVISLQFDLRYINYMYKCQNLCDYVYIHLTPKGIMFLSYEINMLGSMLVGIAPRNPETIQDYDDDNDQYYEDNRPIRVKKSL